MSFQIYPGYLKFKSRNYFNSKIEGNYEKENSMFKMSDFHARPL